MGLDVYLYKCSDLEKHKTLQSKLEKVREDAWQLIQNGRKYEELSESEKDAARDAANQAEADLKKIHGSLNLEEGFENNSSKHPEHMFKVGYFRSSYNDGGLNSVLRKNGLSDLNEIFRENSDEYILKPDWEKSLIKAKTVLTALEKIKDRTYSVMDIDFNPFKAPEIHTELQALEIFNKMLAERPERTVAKDDFNWFGNSDGEWFLGKPPKLLAAFPGIRKSFRDTNEPCVYLVIDQGESVMKWYYEAIEVVIETIEYVLAQPDKQDYYFHWSG